MHSKILNNFQFATDKDFREKLALISDDIVIADYGIQCKAGPKKRIALGFDGCKLPVIHTRNGDSIELIFMPQGGERGRIYFGFTGGFESCGVTLDFRQNKATLTTSDFTAPQPVAGAPFTVKSKSWNSLRLVKTEGGGKWVKLADMSVFLNDKQILSARNLNVLPEMSVSVDAHRMTVNLQQLIHRGVSSGIPKELHVGGWQMPNKPSIEENLQSIFRGLQEAAERGVQLLVTPETSLTGLFPQGKVTTKEKPVIEAEQRLMKYMATVKNCPYLVVGMPQWQKVAEHKRRKTRYNISRVYNPDGTTLATCPKVHSCE